MGCTRNYYQLVPLFSRLLDDPYPKQPPKILIVDKMQDHEYVDKNGVIIHPIINSWGKTSQMDEVFRVLLEYFIENPLKRLSEKDKFELIDEKDLAKNNFQQNSAVFAFSSKDVTECAKLKLECLTEEQLKYLNSNDSALLSFYCDTDPIKELSQCLINTVENAKIYAQSNVNARNAIMVKTKEYEAKLDQLKLLKLQLEKVKNTCINEKVFNLIREKDLEI